MPGKSPEPIFRRFSSLQTPNYKGNAMLSHQDTSRVDTIYFQKRFILPLPSSAHVPWTATIIYDTVNNILSADARRPPSTRHKRAYRHFGRDTPMARGPWPGLPRRHTLLKTRLRLRILAQYCISRHDLLRRSASARRHERYSV